MMRLSIFMQLPFRTLQQAVEVEGIGLHTGQQVRVRLLPTNRLGLVFARTDLSENGETPEVAADLRFVTTTTHATTLENGTARVQTTEHLLAALWSCGITHCRIEISGPEVPIFDGSSALWVKKISEAQAVDLAGNRPVFRLPLPVWIQSGEAHILGLDLPDITELTFRLTVAVNFDHPHAGPQTIEGIISQEFFESELALARTFTLESWLLPLRDAGLIRGGSTDNAVVLSENGPSSPWRWPDEIARHKALDAIGDLALLLAPTGAQLHGHIVAIRGGHGAHHQWMQKVLTLANTRRL